MCGNHFLFVQSDCPTGELMCQGLNFTQCVPNTYLCDGNNNCPNGFDESICTIGTRQCVVCSQF